MRLRKWLRPLVVRYRHRGLGGADAFLASYPRSGSTWLRFMLFELLSEQEADFDRVNRAVPYVGDHRQAPAFLPDGGRLIKTHEVHRPALARATIYLVRDVRAVLPSMFKQQKRAGYRGTLDTFLETFLQGDAGPFGTWWDHAALWLDSSDGKTTLLRFEDMRARPKEALDIVLAALGVSVDDASIEAAVRRNELREMKTKEGKASTSAILNRRSDLPFVGSGATDAWRRELSEASVVRIERAAGRMMTRLGYDLITDAAAD